MSEGGEEWESGNHVEGGMDSLPFSMLWHLGDMALDREVLEAMILAPRRRRLLSQSES